MHLKGIPNTNLLICLKHAVWQSANLEIFDISHQGRARKVYSFDEVQGSINYLLYLIFKKIIWLD